MRVPRASAPAMMEAAKRSLYESVGFEVSTLRKTETWEGATMCPGKGVGEESGVTYDGEGNGLQMDQRQRLEGR